MKRLLFRTALLAFALTMALVSSASAQFPTSLVHYWNFDESASGTGNATAVVGPNTGTFQGTATRTTGLIGVGAAQFNDTSGDGVNVGTTGYSFTSGLTIETVFQTNYDGAGQEEFFRKEDGNNRILLSFQQGSIIGGSQFVGGTDDGLPGISFGINTGGYGELDVELDGQGTRPTLAELADGETHHLVATYDATTGVKSLYVDGELIGAFDVGDNINLTSGGGADAFIGNLNAGTEPFGGILDEVAIYNAAFSPDDVAAHFANVQNGLNVFAVVPEPSSLAVWAVLGIVGIGLYRMRRKKS